MHFTGPDPALACARYTLGVVLNNFSSNKQFPKEIPIFQLLSLVCPETFLEYLMSLEFIVQCLEKTNSNTM